MTNTEHTLTSSDLNVEIQVRNPEAQTTREWRLADRERRRQEQRGAWGERFEFEGEKYDPCIEGDDEDF